jgi:hypothetical protein
MSKTGFAAIVVLSVVCAGCSLFRNAKQTLCEEPRIYSRQKDDRFSREQYREWAAMAWQGELQTNADACRSPEYQCGFEEGFFDYVYAGGTGEPPPVPPRRMWNLDYRTPEGHQAVDAWFAGFRRGACVARTAGYRECVTVRSSLLIAQRPAAMPPATESVPPPSSIPAEPNGQSSNPDDAGRAGVSQIQ